MAGTPVYAVVVTALALTIGSVVSMYATDILKGLWLQGDGGIVYNGPAWVVLALAVVWLVLFFVRQAAEAKALADLGSLVELTRESVLTVPSAPFMSDLSRFTTQAHTGLLAALPRVARDDADKTSLSEIIRILLGLIASLAGSYDTRGGRYAANVMVFVPRRNVEPHFGDVATSDVLSFLPENFDLAAVNGCLVLDPTLSTFAGGGTLHGYANDEIDKVVFGIREDYVDESGAWKILPGAPLALVKWNHRVGRSKNEELLQFDLRLATEAIDDLWKIRRVVRRGSGDDVFLIGDDVLKKVVARYSPKSNRRIRSVLSFPLVKPDGSRSAFGVLNVHCDLANFLGDVPHAESVKRRNTYAAVVAPLVFEVSSAVAAWMVAKPTAAKATGSGPTDDAPSVTPAGSA